MSKTYSHTTRDKLNVNKDEYKLSSEKPLDRCSLEFASDVWTSDILKGKYTQKINKPQKTFLSHGIKGTTHEGSIQSSNLSNTN